MKTRHIPAYNFVDREGRVHFVCSELHPDDPGLWDCSDDKRVRAASAELGRRCQALLTRRARTADGAER